MPTRASIGSVGYDLYCPIEVMLEKDKVVRIPIGIKLESSNDYWAQIYPRSSMGLKGISIMGGVIDPDYKGEISVLLMSHGKYNHIRKHDKIAQLVFHKCEFPINITSHEIRGEFGFGSSGK